MPLIWCWVNRSETNESHLMLILLCLDIIANGSINILASKSTISGSPALLCVSAMPRAKAERMQNPLLRYIIFAERVCVCVPSIETIVKFLQSKMNLLPSFEAFGVIRLAHSHGTWIFTHHSGRSEQYAWKWLLTHCTSGALPKHLCHELYGTNRTSINRNIFYSNKSIVSVHLLRIQSIFMQRTPTNTHVQLLRASLPKVPRALTKCSFTWTVLSTESIGRSTFEHFN